MTPTSILALLALAPIIAARTQSPPTAALSPTCAPGGNFDLSIWNLQLPTGQPGSPTTIKPAGLQGCDGYQNASVFYTDETSGAMVMKVPGGPESSGCVTTPNSAHCRTELREVLPANQWNANATVNRLTARLAVPVADDSTHGTVVGQIHIADSTSTKPVCELYYNQDGLLAMGVELTRAGGKQHFTDLGTVPLGDHFSYEIRYESGQLSVAINGGDLIVLGTFDLWAPPSYFKAGNYNQGSSPSEVHFYEVFVRHEA